MSKLVNIACTWTESFSTFFFLWQQKMNWGEKQGPLCCLCTACLIMRTEAYIPSAVRKNFLWKTLGCSSRSIPFFYLSLSGENYRSFFSGQEQVVRETRADLESWIGFIFKGSVSAHLLRASLFFVPWWCLLWSEMPLSVCANNVGKKWLLWKFWNVMIIWLNLSVTIQINGSIPWWEFLKAILFSLFILPSLKVGNEMGSSSSESFPPVNFEKSKPIKGVRVCVSICLLLFP